MTYIYMYIHVYIKDSFMLFCINAVVPIRTLILVQIKVYSHRPFQPYGS